MPRSPHPPCAPPTTPPCTKSEPDDRYSSSPPASAPPSPPRSTWLRAELIKTRLAHGFCSRDPVAGACAYSNICEQCDNFVPDPSRADLISDQLDDVRHLHADAD